MAAGLIRGFQNVYAVRARPPRRPLPHPRHIPAGANGSQAGDLHMGDGAADEVVMTDASAVKSDGIRAAA